jgi:hypothetical protein
VTASCERRGPPARRGAPGARLRCATPVARLRSWRARVAPAPQGM